MDLQGQRILPAEKIGAVALSPEINHRFGSETTKLTKPAQVGKQQFKHLVLIAEVGSWRIRLGDHVAAGMPGAYAVAGDVTDGTGALGLLEGNTLILPAPAEITVKSYDAADCLTYFWI